MVTTDNQDFLGSWLCDRIDVPYIKDAGTYVGNRSAQGELIAVAGYDNYRGRSVMMHIAAEGHQWLKGEFLWYIFYYPFIQMGVDKIIAPVSSWNRKAVRLVEHCGFKEEARIAESVLGGDLVFMTLHRDNCRFLHKT